MPIYEFQCNACGHPFEALLYGSETAVCPECGGADLVKQFSGFAVGGAAPAAGADCPAYVPGGG